jgi:hypothetical protein
MLYVKVMGAVVTVHSGNVPTSVVIEYINVPSSLVKALRANRGRAAGATDANGSGCMTYVVVQDALVMLVSLMRQISLEKDPAIKKKAEFPVMDTSTGPKPTVPTPPGAVM